MERVVVERSGCFAARRQRRQMKGVVGDAIGEGGSDGVGYTLLQRRSALDGSRFGLRRNILAFPEV